MEKIRRLNRVNQVVVDFCAGDIGVNIGGGVCGCAETARQNAMQCIAVSVVRTLTMRGYRGLSRVRYMMFAELVAGCTAASHATEVQSKLLRSSTLCQRATPPYECAGHLAVLFLLLHGSNVVRKVQDVTQFLGCHE